MVIFTDEWIGSIMGSSCKYKYKYNANIQIKKYPKLYLIKEYKVEAFEEK